MGISDWPPVSLLGFGWVSTVCGFQPQGRSASFYDGFTWYLELMHGSDRDKLEGGQWRCG